MIFFVGPYYSKTSYSSQPWNPKIYGQPKIHKSDIPLRPIVNAIGAPTHALSHFLAEKL
jgi:hypothetical protein